jgi:protein phosphatase
MEDAHVIHLEDDWAFFGVFDGHSGQACSAFVSRRFREELDQRGCPEDDSAVKSLVLGIDREFLASQQPSGSTGTMCIVHRPKQSGDRHLLRVANVGDSRVLLGRRDGSIVDGGGTDQGLTTDHKPDLPSERARIERCGGTVRSPGRSPGQSLGRVARVNGELSVSRAFGDSRHKRTGGPGPEDRPITADPELARFECDEADFLLLVCDGVSECSFPACEVVSFVAHRLSAGVDAGTVARLACLEAIRRGSRDNVTCMIVLLTGSDATEKRVEFVPGPITHIHRKGFQSAYQEMAHRAGLSLAQAAALRFEVVQQELRESPTDALREELASLGRPEGEPGSAEQLAWFEAWLRRAPPAFGGPPVRL